MYLSSLGCIDCPIAAETNTAMVTSMSESGHAEARQTRQSQSLIPFIKAPALTFGIRNWGFDNRVKFAMSSSTNCC